MSSPSPDGIQWITKGGKRNHPLPTSRSVTARDGTGYRMWDDGTLRRDPPKLRGKAAVKAAKRARQRERYHAVT